MNREHDPMLFGKVNILLARGNKQEEMQSGLPCSLDSNHNRSHIRHICRVGLALLQTGHPLTHDFFTFKSSSFASNGSQSARCLRT